MDNAESVQAIAPEQYGARKRHSAQTQALNKRLTLDLYQQKKVPAILCSNDAKSCYDRVVHPVVMMALQRLGVPSEAILSMIGTFQSMQHHLRTSYGDTDEYFTCNDAPINFHGLG